MIPYYEADGITIYHGDCFDVLPVALVAERPALAFLDPPYNGVVEADWDNAWKSDDEFLSWCARLLGIVEPALTDNGTLYWCCSSEFYARIEVMIRMSMNVIASCVWRKPRFGVVGSGVDVTALRTYWSCTSERIVVAEKRPVRFLEADAEARNASGYWDACEGAKRAVFGDYLQSEFDRFGKSRKEIAELFPSKTGNLTGCVSNWVNGNNCPTQEQYSKMREFLGDGALERQYEDLRRQYEDLRRQYEDLRRQYEDLRRPFFLTAEKQWGEVWDFPLPKQRTHVAQKPIEMLLQVIDTSSRQGDLVIDATMGSGTTLVAAKKLGRRAIGIDKSKECCDDAIKKLRQGVLPLYAPASV